jgi:acyl-CoA synthetase (AMP-forming)/AMP-acid ligase II
MWDLVVARAQATPDALLVVDERRRRLTFGQFREAAERAAAGLAARGVGHGTIVSWQLPSWIETIVLTFALARLGAVQNPLVMMLREPEVEFICGQLGAELLIVPPSFRGHDHAAMAHAVARRLPGLDVLVSDGTLPGGDPKTLPAEPAGSWVFYTSGTTAAPKGARHTDAGLLAAAQTYVDRIAPGPEDRIAALAPIAHVGGVLHVVAALLSGAGLIITDIFEPAATARLLGEESVTYGGNGTPFVRAFLAEQRKQPDVPLFPLLKCFLIGGAPRPAELNQQVRDELGGTGLASGFGLTECPFFAWADPRADETTRATTEGPPGPGCEALIVRDDGTPEGPGELRIKGPQLMVGYVDSALDADAFDADGWFRTGDLAFLDAAGNLTITGRLKDVIIRNMENISAREVEDLFSGCPGVADWTVLGLPDVQTGERVCAVVVAEPDGPPPTLESVCAHLRAGGLNPRKLPAQLEVRYEIPRNGMGKVAKAALARDIEESARSARSTR